MNDRYCVGAPAVRTAAVLVAVMGAASAAHGFSPYLDVRVSLDGSTWSDAVDATAGQTVRVGVFCVFDPADGIAFAGGVFNVLTDSARSGDSVFANSASVLAPFDFGPQSVAVFTRADGFRIDHSSDIFDNPNGGINCHQEPPTRTGVLDTQNPAFLVMFEYRLGDSADLRSIRLDIGQVAYGRLGLYQDMNDSSGLRMAAGASDAAMIRVPAPAGLAVLGVAAVGRRRRR